MRMCNDENIKDKKHKHLSSRAPTFISAELELFIIIIFVIIVIIILIIMIVVIS